MVHSHDVIVLGHGIAGAAFVEECRRRGLRVAVVGERRPGEASRAAAALVNPVVVKRMVPSWRAAEVFPLARAHYEGIGTLEGMPFWHEVSLDTVLGDEAAVRQWAAREHAPELTAFVRPGIDPRPPVEGIRTGRGLVRVPACARLDVGAMLDAQQRRLQAAGHWSGPLDVRTGPDGVRAGRFSAPLLVRCEGAFARLPGLVPVKGETLLLHIPGLGLRHVVHGGVFLLPMGGDHYRLGATFKWTNVWEGPTEEGRRWLLDKLAVILEPATMARVAVVEQVSGVRPTSRDRRPILGRTSRYEAVFNGLGSRGVLLAPWCARHLAAHLFDGVALDAEVDVARFTQA
jgi:glycine oxidase